MFFLYFSTTLILHFLLMNIYNVNYVNKQLEPEIFRDFFCVSVFFDYVHYLKNAIIKIGQPKHIKRPKHLFHIHSGIRLETVFVSAAFDLIVLCWVNTHVIYHPRSKIDASVAILERVGIGFCCTLQ